MYKQMTLPLTDNATSSQASADGATPQGSPEFQTTTHCGPEVALASHSAPLGSNEGQQTSAICGQNLPVSSRSAALQSQLESRLRALLEGRGFPAYSLTWKHWDMPQRPPICALRASVRRTSGNGSTGLPTPSGTSHNSHVAGRLDEWGGSSNPFRGTSLGRVHCPSFELWMMGFPAAWLPRTARETLSSLRSRRRS